MAIKKQPRIDKTRQLFVDDSIIAESRGTHRTLHQLTKDSDNPIVHCDRPWEGNDIRAYGSIWREPGDGQLRMWYLARPRDLDDRRFFTSVCYATSTDGLHWTKPDLHLCDFWGNTANNVCFQPHWKSDKATGRFDTVSILHDPSESRPLRRYKMMTYQYAVPDKWNPKAAFPSGNYVAFSPDGFHWQEQSKPVFRLDHGIGDCMTLMHDTPRKRYTAFVKILSPEYGLYPELREKVGDKIQIWDGKKYIFCSGENPVRRLRGISFSDDFVHWTKPKFILPTDKDDPPDIQMYNNTGFLYGNLYLGMAYVYHVDTTGGIDMQLIWSRDGEQWQRAFDRTPILPNGVDERDWDMGCHAMFTNPPIQMGDELWFYYGSQWKRHGGGQVKRHSPLFTGSGTAFGRAKLRLDGFVSLDAGNRTARVTTVPIRLAASALAVNANAAGGEIRAQIVRRGHPLTGFDFKSCEPLTVDRTRHVFRFKGGKIPLGASGSPIRIEFSLKNAQLYSFWTESFAPSNL